jgi:hypothetical protein
MDNSRRIYRIPPKLRLLTKKFESDESGKVTESDDSEYIDIVPGILEAFCEKTYLYEAIDKLYQTNKFDFYRLARESKYYSHVIIKEKSLMQEEYGRKILGIIEYLNQEDLFKDLRYQFISSEYEKLLKEGFRYTYEFVLKNSKVDYANYIIGLYKKNKVGKVFDSLVIRHNIYIMIYLSFLFKKPIIDRTENTFRDVMEAYKIRIDCYEEKQKKGENDSILVLPDGSYPNEEHRKVISLLKKQFAKNYPPIENIDSLNLHETLKKISAPVSFVFESYGLNIDEILHDIPFFNTNLESLLLGYYVHCTEFKFREGHLECNLTDDDFLTYLPLTVVSILFAKHYKKMKEYYFKNNREAMYIELEESLGQQEELKKENERLKGKIMDCQNEIINLERHIKKLNRIIEENEKNKNELIGLRELLFNQQPQQEEAEYGVDPKVDYDLLRRKRLLVVGGHDKWQEKMREKLQSSIFINSENLSFDTRLLNSVDYIFINTNSMSHALYNRVMSYLKKTDKEVAYIPNHTNIDYSIRFIYNKVMA